MEPCFRVHHHHNLCNHQELYHPIRFPVLRVSETRNHKKWYSVKLHRRPHCYVLLVLPSRRSSQLHRPKWHSPQCRQLNHSCSLLFTCKTFFILVFLYMLLRSTTQSSVLPAPFVRWLEVNFRNADVAKSSRMPCSSVSSPCSTRFPGSCSECSRSYLTADRSSGSFWHLSVMCATAAPTHSST